MITYLIFYSLQPGRRFLSTNKSGVLIRRRPVYVLKQREGLVPFCCLTLFENHRASQESSHKRANPQHPVSHACCISALFHLKCQSCAASPSWQLNAGCPGHVWLNPTGRDLRCVCVCEFISISCRFMKSRTAVRRRRACSIKVSLVTCHPT